MVSKATFVKFSLLYSNRMLPTICTTTQYLFQMKNSNEIKLKNIFDKKKSQNQFLLFALLQQLTFWIYVIFLYRREDTKMKLCTLFPFECKLDGVLSSSYLVEIYSIKDFVMSDHSVIDGYGSVNSCNIMTNVRHAPQQSQYVITSSYSKQGLSVSLTDGALASSFQELCSVASSCIPLLQ